MNMVYTKRTLEDVKDTFELWYSVRGFFKKRPTVGVNALGIWIHLEDQDQPYGFFEWRWIKEVLADRKRLQVYFVMYDMDAVYENVILWSPKFMMKTEIKRVGNLKALRCALTKDLADVLVYACERGWVILGDKE